MGGIFFSRPVPTEEKPSLKRKLNNSEVGVQEAFVKETPTKKRIRTTYDYVYNELYTQGKGSDVTIFALGREWKLHKLYIKQSPFFSAMFDGVWKEAKADTVVLDLPDPNITEESLQIVFGSLYSDNVEISEHTVINIMAAATWFQLDDIRSSCEEYMKENVRLDNVVCLYDFSEQYNLSALQEMCVEWLGRAILVMEEEEAVISLLKSVSLSFITRILKSPKTFVIQIEQDLLILLIKWVFLQCNQSYIVNLKSEFVHDAFQFYKYRKVPFLETAEGACYKDLFRCLRWENIISVHKTATSLSRDKIAPEAWLMEAYKTQWLRMLKCNESNDPGPEEDLEENLFWEHSERCGRRLLLDNPCSWRWSGFNYGLDMVFRYKERNLYVSRFTDAVLCEGAVSHVATRRVQLSVRIASLTEQGDLLSQCATNAVLQLRLVEGVQHRLLTLPRDMTFPIVISASVLRAGVLPTSAGKTS